MFHSLIAMYEVYIEKRAPNIFVSNRSHGGALITASSAKQISNELDHVARKWLPSITDYNKILKSNQPCFGHMAFIGCVYVGGNSTANHL